MPPQRRVVITGLGVVSPIGTGAADFAAALRAGRDGRGEITAFDTTGYAHAWGCPVPDFEPGRWLRRVPAGELSRAAQFAAVAGRLAVADAGLTEADLNAARCHISIGTTEGGGLELDQLTSQWIALAPSRSREPGHPGRQGIALAPSRSCGRGDLAAKVPAALLSVAVARELGLAGVPASTLATACSAGNYAIGDGLDAIRAGEADLALCGGADAICRKTFTAFYRLGLVAPERCRPFDAGRQGILTGEGGGVLLLESLGSALARGARIYAEVAGFGLNCDAYHCVAPSQEAVARCMRLALDDAGVKPEEVDLISAHGTGTRTNDVTECAAIREVYGDAMPRVVSLKSMLGHTMGAACALAAIGCALAIARRFIPPTINHRAPDPGCPVDCVPNAAISAGLRIVQNNGLAFGGNNAVVILARYEGAVR